MTDNTKMREEFEKFAMKEGMSLDMYKLSYLSDETYSAYKAWQAARTVPVVGEAAAWTSPEWLKEKGRLHGMTRPHPSFKLPLYRAPTTSITQAELDAKDARIRELEAANASLEASYRGSCMMYDATKVELKALRKDAENWRNRHEVSK